MVSSLQLVEVRPYAEEETSQLRLIIDSSSFSETPPLKLAKASPQSLHRVTDDSDRNHLSN